ncbi:10 TM acyl transferase domain found in Cas1p-domain-containing protein [Protomyces lactucae-debilis]|uniref:10 TM acyl transferase domain found in Cas1p-domain-containing protein n=1 Tax=Protomyces lactucae-debilis TaxID=2754530 RepID=A0A1Y2FSM9_PROLT|nr:10 TM acyl transferase domain found in Cas1p-domain-containing protein [Protomyces lactucae-debilis]ORY86196.1 10 TM acyl transferase domain found in Cas1p-domain-containing protein [Protomyces lactucae-debilis]
MLFASEPTQLLRAVAVTLLLCAALLLPRHYKSASTRCEEVLHTGDWYGACLERQSIFFLGDSIARNLFESLARRIDPDVPLPGKDDLDARHKNLPFPSARKPKGMRDLAFFWDPYLEKPHFMADGMTIVSTGLWALKNKGAEAVSQFNTSLHALVERFEMGKTPSSRLILLPVSMPVIARLSPGRAALDDITSINAMNKILDGFTTQQQIHSPHALLQMQRGMDVQGPDGLHFNDAANQALINVLLNYECNKALTSAGLVKSSCCAQPRVPPSKHLLVILTISLLAVVLLVSLLKDDLLCRPLYFAMVLLTAVGFYINLADRTSFMAKIPKQFEAWPFAGWHLLALVAGLRTLKREEKDPGILSRHQTDEWKGWMQISILFYHYYGASKRPSIYIGIRCMVSAYLFMTGYGHTLFYLNKADYSLKRVMSVLVRLNLLTCYLAVLMDSNVLFYYFAPLVTFWYVSVLITMRLGQHLNDINAAVVFKVLILMLVSTFLVRFPGLLESIGSLAGKIFNTQWDMKEYRFRMALDLYAVPIGMLFAIAQRSFPKALSERAWKGIRALGLIISLITLLAYIITSLFVTDKYAYNKVHPYLSPFAVVAFVLIRNATPGFRATHSRFFAFWGHISLETFTLQYHIWLADDTQNLLQLPIADALSSILSLRATRLVNMFTTTIIFVWVAYEVAQATATITTWFVKKPETKEIVHASDDLELEAVLALDCLALQHD